MDYKGKEMRLLEGYKGELIINKLYHNRKMYSFVEPIIQQGSIYAVYLDGGVYFYATDAKYSPHISTAGLNIWRYNGRELSCPENIRFLCLGSYKDKYSTCTTKEARESCIGAVEVFKTISSESTSNILNMPPQYTQELLRIYPKLGCARIPDEKLFRPLL
jgi:hypothetical protein